MSDSKDRLDNQMVIIETPRLLLRQFHEEDITSLHPVFSDPETMTYYPAPFNIQQTQDWITRNQDRYANDGYGIWVLQIRTNEVNKYY